MTTVDILIPHLLKWECAVEVRSGETLEAAYARAANKGITKVKGDLGGATLCGVTLRTFTEWRLRQSKPKPTEADLAKLKFAEWRQILDALFWKPTKADEIKEGRVALMLVDWRWVNGGQAIRDAQNALSLVQDGIVGPKTITALNTQPNILERLRAARLRAYEKIVERNPSQQKFLQGWKNRTNSI